MNSGVFGRVDHRKIAWLIFAFSLFLLSSFYYVVLNYLFIDSLDLITDKIYLNNAVMAGHFFVACSVDNFILERTIIKNCDRFCKRFVLIEKVLCLLSSKLCCVNSAVAISTDNMSINFSLLIITSSTVIFFFRLLWLEVYVYRISIIFSFRLKSNEIGEKRGGENEFKQRQKAVKESKIKKLT